MNDAPRSRRWRVPLALAVVVVLGTVAALRLLPGPPPPSVLVVGDSVTYLSEDEIDGAFGRAQVQFVARWGYTSSDLLPVVEDAMGTTGDPANSREQIALLVGYNDVGNDDVATPSLPKLVANAAEFRCGVFLTVPTRVWGEPNAAALQRADRGEIWNARVRDEVERRPNLHVVEDWNEAVESSAPGELLTDDGLHPNDKGQRVLAAVYRDAIDRYC